MKSTFLCHWFDYSVDYSADASETRTQCQDRIRPELASELTVVAGLKSAVPRARKKKKQGEQGSLDLRQIEAFKNSRIADETSEVLAVELTVDPISSLPLEPVNCTNRFGRIISIVQHRWSIVRRLISGHEDL